MSKSKLLTLAAGVALLVALFAAVAAPGAAFAQGPTPPPTTPTNTIDQTFWQSLANKLGITVERLQQAVKDAAKEAIAGAVSNNRLTQSQADALNQRVDQWTPNQGLPFGGRGGDHGFGKPGAPNSQGQRGQMPGGPGMMGGTAMLDAAAKALGMTTADVQTQLQSGKTLADLAQSKNVSQDTVKQAIVAAEKAQVDQLQQAGRITADQATQMKQRIDQNAANLDLTKPFGRGFGPGGFGMPGAPNGRGGRGFPGATPQGQPSTPAQPKPQGSSL